MINCRQCALALALLLLTNLLWAGSVTSTYAADNNFEPEHKVVIQVSSADPKTQHLAIANAINLQKHYGIDHVAVEIVAYGPGLAMLTKSSDQTDRVRSLSAQDVRFSACRNTMRAISAKTGKTPVLTEGVKVVPAGVGRIIELQEAGYSYVRP